MRRESLDVWGLWGLASIAVVLFAAVSWVELRAGTTSEISHGLLSFRIAFLGGLVLFVVAVTRLYTTTGIVSDTEYPRILVGTAVIVLLWTAITLLGLFAAGGFQAGLREWLWPFNLGVLIGFCVGLVLSGREARLVKRTRTLAREQERTSQLETNRGQASQLIGLLRHHLLNGLNVIAGNAALLEDRFTDPPQELSTIQRRAATIADQLEDVTLLIQADAQDIATRPVDLVGILEQELADLQQGSDIEVVTSTPAELPVQANQHLQMVLRNLLRMAVGDGEMASESLSVETVVTDTEVEFRVTNPAYELPTDSRPIEDLADPMPNLEIQVATSLVEAYDGTLTRTAREEGTEFILTLPKAGATADPD